MHSQNEFVDLSGIGDIGSGNPYNALIDVCHGDASQIQERYNTHRDARNKQQKARLTAPGFAAVDIDSTLEKLINPWKYPNFRDERHCLVFWARPPSTIRELIHELQLKLRAAAPNLWFMHPDCLHMTTLEITHSLKDSEIRALVETVRPKAQDITDYPFDHRARLIKPMLSYDASAVALSFVPAAGEGKSNVDDQYTYHHLRRDIYCLCKSTGVEVASRYTVPSAHLTIARFICQDDFQSNYGEEYSESENEEFPLPGGGTGFVTGSKRVQPKSFDAEKMRSWVDILENINRWLREKYWPTEAHNVPPGGEWIVGQEKGLDFRMGTLWYGGGETIRLGKGFPVEATAKPSSASQ